MICESCSFSENEIELKSSLGSNCHHNNTDVLLVTVKEVMSLFILIDNAMWRDTLDYWKKSGELIEVVV